MAVTELEFKSIVEYAKNSSNPNYIDWKNSTKKSTKNNDPVTVGLFTKFWLAYPSTSEFSYNNRFFEGDRTLRSNKQVCYGLFYDSIQYIVKNYPEKELSLQTAADALLSAMNRQVDSKKRKSCDTGRNELNYMKSCEVYLRQKDFEAWLFKESTGSTMDMDSMFSL